MGLERRKEGEARQALAFPLSGSRQHRCPAPARSPIPTHGSSRLSGSSAPGSPLPCAAGDRRELPSGAAAGTGRFRPSPLKGCGGLRTPDRPPGRAVPAEGQVPAEPDPRTEAGRAGPPPRAWTRRPGRAGPPPPLAPPPPRARALPSPPAGRLAADAGARPAPQAPRPRRYHFLALGAAAGLARHPARPVRSPARPGRLPHRAEPRRGARRDS